MVAYKTEGTPYLEERYASKESWQKDYDAAIAKTEKNVKAAKELKAYMSDEDWAKINNFTSKDFKYIQEVKKYNKEIVRIKDEALAAKQKKIEEQKKKEKENTISSTQKNTNSSYSGSSKLTRSGGVNYYNGNKETYYNLDMSGVIKNARSMGIQGEYWVRSDGVKMYGEYVIVAAQLSKGTIISTSLGTGIVLDYCPAGTIDIAVCW